VTREPQDLSAWSLPGTELSVAGCYLHASAVAIDGRAVLFLGPSGSGKSGLALTLMGFGAQLVADDAVWVRALGASLIVARPDTATDRIECRGIGLLPAGPVVAEARLVLALDMAQAEAERLPPRREVAFDGRTIPLIRGAGHPFLAQAALQILRSGAEPWHGETPDGPTARYR
jgi:HPr kinase/phosphorylase